MKKLYFFLAFFSLAFVAKASEATSENLLPRGYGETFIFIEGGVEFAIFPDGQFDFHFDPRRKVHRNIRINPRADFSFNHGYNYDPFVQYDDFGAVVQIENVPIYYDFYGRIVQAGRVRISYNHFGQIERIGNLHIHYNRHHHMTHYTGFINRFNRQYVYRPWHQYYTRPSSYSIVYHQPYRQYYTPQRFEYVQYRSFYNNYYGPDFRRSYYNPGDKVVTYHRGTRGDNYGETRSERDLYERETENHLRSNRNSERTKIYSDSRDISSRTMPQSSDNRGRYNREVPTVQRETISRSRSERTVEPQVRNFPSPRERETVQERRSTPVRVERPVSNDPQPVESRSSRGRGN